MKVLLSCPNLQGALCRLSLCILDLDRGHFQWVDTGGFLQAGTDLGVTGLARVADGYLLAIQSPTRPRLVHLAPDLTYMRSATVEGLRDPHGLAVEGESVFVASTGTNTVYRYEPKSGRFWTHWRFERNPAQDALHLSSVLVADGALLATAHNDPRSYPARDGRGCVLNLDTGAVVVEGLDHPHSLAQLAGRLHVLDSQRGELLRLAADGTVELRSALGGFLRGIAPVAGRLLVGISSHRLHSRKEGAMLAYQSMDDGWMTDPKFRSAIALVDPLTLAEQKRYEFTLLAPEIFDALPLTSDPAESVLIDDAALWRTATMRHEIWMLTRRGHERSSALSRLRGEVRRRVLHDHAILRVDGITQNTLRGTAFDPAQPANPTHVRVVIDDRHVFYARADLARASAGAAADDRRPSFSLQLPSSVLSNGRHVVVVDIPDAIRCEPVVLEVRAAEAGPAEAPAAAGIL